MALGVVEAISKLDPIRSPEQEASANAALTAYRKSYPTCPPVAKLHLGQLPPTLQEHIAETLKRELAATRQTLSGLCTSYNEASARRAFLMSTSNAVITHRKWLLGSAATC